MSWRTFAKHTAVALPLAACLGCASISKTFNKAFSKQSEGLDQIDEVITRIEAVHVECELSKASLRDSVEWLCAIVAQDFGGSAVGAYDEFVDSVETSNERAEELQDAVAPMRKAAEPFFDKWEDDLWAFKSAEMRQHSEKRMNDARERYDAIVAAVEPAQDAYVSFNQNLDDIVLFLGNDFNAASELEREVRALTRLAGDIDTNFDACLTAAEAYIDSAALPAMVEVEEITEEAPRPTKRRKATSR